MELKMREYMSHEAEMRSAFGRWSGLVRRVWQWRARKDLKTLLKFSDYQLRDIGLSRHDVVQLIEMPLSRDLTWELERRGREWDQVLPGDAPEAPKAAPKPHRTAAACTS
jgi:uncharacterized protein YjiS (DUF1127 family)